MFAWPHVCGLQSLSLSAPLLSRGVSARLALSWGDAAPVAQRIQIGWALTVSAADRLDLLWTEQLAARCDLLWSGVVARRLLLPWSAAVPATRRLALSWSLTAPSASRCGLPWALQAYQQAAARCSLPWAAPGAGQVVQSGVELVAENGRWLRPLRATVQLSEGSPFWSADITLGSEEEAAQFDIGSFLTLSLCGHSFSLRVDQITEDAQGPAACSWSVHALSPVAWLDSPYVLSSDVSFDAGTTASDAVTALLAPAAPVAWAVPDWTLPAAGLVFTSTTPLVAARAIVEAIGGLLESAPDGSILVRRRYPMPPAEFATATPDLDLFDSEALTRSVSTVHVDLVNRLTISDGSSSSQADGQDRLEYEAGANPLAGTVRAWPSPWRPVRLVHTGRPSVAITALGPQVWSVDELVEFKGGQAQLGTQPQSVLRVIWRNADLGAVTLDGDTLTAESGAGYSLAEVRYATRAYVWSVTDDQVEDVQFLLEDD